MKKVFSVLRSMRFANLLLALVALLCGLSSLLPQGRELPFYAENYPQTYTLIYRTHFYDVFKSWYFVLLLALLCLSLVLCTVRMLRKALSWKTERERAAALPNAESLAPGQLEDLRRYMASIRCREEKTGDGYLFTKNSLGRWGVFLLHLSILLVVAFGVCALALPKVTDQDCRVGESVLLEDGTEIEVLRFRMTNESGQLDYASDIRVTLPNGLAKVQEIKVNYPMTFGSIKVFQWTYGVGASIQAKNRTDGTEQSFALDQAAFLSSDGLTGLQYLGIYEAAPQEGEEGESYVFYRARVVSNGNLMPEMELLPGGSVTVGDWDFTALDPYYPGLRIKQMPFPFANSLLEAAFVLMLAGMFLSFYLQPVLVKADEAGYTVAGPRPEKMRLELRRKLIQEGEKA